MMVLLRVEALGGIFQRCKANVAQLRGFYELGLNHVVFFLVSGWGVVYGALRNALCFFVTPSTRWRCLRLKAFATQPRCALRDCVALRKKNRKQGWGW